ACLWWPHAFRMLAMPTMHEERIHTKFNRHGVVEEHQGSRRTGLEWNINPKSVLFHQLTDRLQDEEVFSYILHSESIQTALLALMPSRSRHSRSTGKRRLRYC